MSDTPERPAAQGCGLEPETAGSQNVNAGNGVQKIYSQSGGSNNRQFNAETIYYTERAPEAQPDYTGTYSYTSLQPVASYVARPGLQKRVEERLENASGTAILVLVGLGGAGKTQLTLNYIQTHSTTYSAVFWVDARLRESVERDFVQIYRLLYGVRGEQASASSPSDIDRVVTAVKTWFHGRHGRWLFVFDNADSLDDESDPYFVDLQRYLTSGPGVDVIITTRSQTATHMTQQEAIKVEELAPAEARDVFVECSELRNPADDVLAEIDRIVAELGFLALAVTLAGSYVAATPRMRSNIREYLPEYRQRRKALLGRKAKQQVHRYGESVLSTWETSFAAMAHKSPTSGRLVGFFAFLDSSDIFPELFRPDAASVIKPPTYVDTVFPPSTKAWGSFLSRDAPLEQVLDDALEALTTYSLIQWKEEQSSYSMHKLVHEWGFDRLDEAEQGEYSSQSLSFLQWVVEGRQLDPAAKLRISPHVSASVARLREWQPTSTCVSETSLYRIQLLANFLRSVGQYPAELELLTFQRGEWERRRREGGEKGWLRGLRARKTEKTAWRNSATSLGNIALVLQRQGKYEEAEAMNRQAIEEKEHVLGKEHLSTLISMENLAMVLKEQGKYKAAEQMCRRALDGKEKALGKEHSMTLQGMNNLATILQDEGRYKEVEQINRRVLEAQEKVLGKEHTDTLTSVNNLASVLCEQGKYEAAEEVYRRAVAGREKALGREHPDTLLSADSLAVALCKQGKYEEAEELQRHALASLQKVNGRDHPHTFLVLANLAATLQTQKKYEAAEQMTRQALEGKEKRLGPEHPSTLLTVANLAFLLHKKQEYAAAAPLYARASTGCVKALGPSHPDTLMYLEKMALNQEKLNELQSAALDKPVASP